MKQILKAIAPVFSAIFFLTGCLSVDYVGQKLPPLPEEDPVEFFNEAMAVPPDQYHTIGRGVLQCAGTTSNGDIKTAFLEEARSVGADAVKIVEFSQRQVGSMEVMTPDTNAGPVDRFDTINDTDAGGAAVYIDSFGQPIQAQNQTRKLYENTVRALFLVKLNRYNEAMTRWREEQTKYRTAQQDELDKEFDPENDEEQ